MIVRFGTLRQRVSEARKFDGLFFASLISQETIENTFGDAKATLDSAQIYTTAVTVWVFLSQVMSIHHGCVSAVAKLIAWRVSRGQSSCSAATGAYCIARDKLDEPSMQRLVTESGKAIDSQAPDQWRWKGLRVVVADGATVTMADTAENQKEYPQVGAQKPGCGFPIIRVLVLFALSTGVVLETALGKYQGKLTHEVSLLRTIDAIIGSGDVLLADRAFAGWFEMARMEQQGAHFVLRMHQMRKADFRTGIRYGKDDHAIRIDKPVRPKWMSEQEYESYPEFIVVREIKIRVTQKGFRTREIIVHTSFDDDIEYSKDEIGLLFRRRWQAELNLRSLKTVMQMEHLRCKKPHRVRNELRAHLLAYNLVRQTMAEAAIGADVQPCQISFKSTLNALSETLPILVALADIDQLCDTLLECCRQHQVGNRPDRYEPRVKKRRAKSYPWMTKPRKQYRLGEHKGK
ncbi:IS4 family transposase [Mariniblastus fucicola]|uniref:Transposase DDE domain protein n=1 Tax=Mariniblastus fucicola TaxID=980251 RepID=A0A5B9PC93_9BACT|nr:IS4 family transposase [Mariniblastus fucicola]QEG22785.1 Transposase DDE domain protein [Mariniblastus fucicola]